jgi:transcriptional regulator with XRE-family HTH domain
VITDERRRRELHDFLRAARARLEPGDIGCAAAPNRRGGGLRQADVAAALAVSGRWYNALENGSGQAVASPGMLDRLAAVLRLTEAERLRLYLLAAGHEPASPAAQAPEPDPGSLAALERLVALAGPDLPAMVCDVAWHMLAWNDALSGRVLDPGALPAADRNLILWLFTPAAAESVGEIGAVRAEEVSRVQLALARYPADPRLGQLTARLRQIPAARRLWDGQHAPGPISVSPRRIRPPGHRSAARSDLVTAEFGQLRLLILVPRGDWIPGPGGTREEPARETPLLPATA